jgi:hypothetical protein
VPTIILAAVRSLYDLGVQSLAWSALAIAAAGCASAAASHGTSEQSGFVRVASGFNSRFTGDIGDVILDSIRWRRVWDSTFHQVRGQAPLPSIDFDKNMLILAAGPPSGAGDSLRVERVTDAGRALKVMVAIHNQCLPAAISTMPHDIVQIHRSTRTPVFENRYVRGPYCSPVDSNLAKAIHRGPQK